MLKIIKKVPVFLGNVVSGLVVIGKFPDESCEDFKDKSIHNSDYATSCILQFNFTLVMGKDNLWCKLVSQYLTQINVVRARDGSISPLINEDSLEVDAVDKGDGSVELIVKYMGLVMYTANLTEKFKSIDRIYKDDAEELISLLEDIEDAVKIEPPNLSLTDDDLNS